MHSNRGFDLDSMNVLIIENDPAMVRLLKNSLFTRIIRIESVNSISEARRMITTRDIGWHCWILNPGTGENGNSLQLIREFNHFPFIILISGLGNMRLSFKATRLGVLDVYDKSPSAPVSDLTDSVIRTSVLGYLLGGKRSDYLQVFISLKDRIFTSAPEWASTSCISLRYLERLCEIHCGMSPRYVLPLYYHLVSSIYSSISEGNQTAFTQRYSPSDRRYFAWCSKFVAHHLEMKYPFLVKHMQPNPDLCVQSGSWA